MNRNSFSLVRVWF